MKKEKSPGFIGRNGAGKTVLMKCICGFVIPTEGEIRIDGRKLRGRKEADLTKIGMIIENSRHFWKLIPDIRTWLSWHGLTES